MIRKIIIVLLILVLLPITTSCITSKEISHDEPKYAYEDTMWICNEFDGWIHFSNFCYIDNDLFNYGEMTINSKTIKINEQVLGNKAILFMLDNVLTLGDTICEAIPDYSEDTIVYKLKTKNKEYIPNECDQLTFIKLQDLDYAHNYRDNENLMTLDLDSDHHFVMSVACDRIQGTVTLKGKKVVLTSDNQIFTFIRDNGELRYERNSSNNGYDLNTIILRTGYYDKETEN